VALGLGSDWAPASYGDYYTRSVPVYAAIRIRAEALVRVPWQASRLRPDGSRDLLPITHPLQQLLDRPNPWLSGAELRRATETYLCLWGRAFWSIEPSESAAGGLEIWPLRPDRVDVLPGQGPRGPYIRGYRYRGQAREVLYLPEEIEFFSYFNPLQDRTGFSPMAPLRLSADMGWDALRYNRNTFRNGAIPDYILLADQELTDTQAQEFYRRWEDRFQGPDRPHRPAIVSSVRDIRPLAFNQREMEFIEGLRWTVKDVSKVYGVPETMLAELQHATLANMEALERWFWRSTIIPEATMLADRISASLLSKLGFPGYQVEFDFSGIEALSEGGDQRLKREQAYLDQGVITVNEVRRSRGLEDVPWGNEPRPRPLLPRKDQGNPDGIGAAAEQAEAPAFHGSSGIETIGEEPPLLPLRERTVLGGNHRRTM
jgi:HK97 family phage portal protein